MANNTPVFRRPYRYSDMERDLIRSWTLDLLEAGLVELSHGEYASATIMPAKKDVHGNYTKIFSGVGMAYLSDLVYRLIG